MVEIILEEYSDIEPTRPKTDNHVLFIYLFLNLLLQTPKLVLHPTSKH